MQVNGTLAHDQTVNGQAPSQAGLARGLGISKSLIGKYRARGMPVDSIEGARAWREKHLLITRRKREPTPKPDADAARLLQRLAAWGELAVQALRVAQFGLIEGDLRETLRLVPREHRADVRLPVEVWRGLLGHIWEILGPAEASPAATKVQLAEVAPLLYQLSCDEAVLRDDDTPPPAA